MSRRQISRAIDTPASIYITLDEAVTSMYRATEVTDSAELCQALIYKYIDLKSARRSLA